MSDIKLLDCTLRDGGYINDWQFGRNNLACVFDRLIDAKVDIVEIGFLDERRPFDRDRSIMPDTTSVKKIYGQCDKKQAMVVGMIDYGTCGLERIQPCEESYLDGIRVIFKKQLMNEAMEYCRQLKMLGYKVFSQLVSITAYTDEDLLKLIKLVNDVEPYAVSMVDTYGLLHPEDVLHYYYLLDDHVKTSIQIGFHAHNNFQLGYANVLAFIGKETQRDIVVDGTLFGMGKSAGNPPLELIAMRLNDKFDKSYNISSMMEAIEESVMPFYKKSPWGYKLFFYMCAKHNCHPMYLTYFEDKQNLSVSMLDRLLAELPSNEKKLLYDRLVAEQIYGNYLESDGNDEADYQSLKQTVGQTPVLLIGPGKNIELQRQNVRNFIEEKKPYIISVNYIPSNIEVDCVFVTNGKRYKDMALSLKEERNNDLKILATSNIEHRQKPFDFVVNRVPLLEMHDTIRDNSFLMLMKVLQNIGITDVYCAGFDGYSEKEDNYFNPLMEYDFVKREAGHLNYYMKRRVADFRKNMIVQFITYSVYDVEEDINLASI